MRGLRLLDQFFCAVLCAAALAACASATSAPTQRSAAPTSAPAPAQPAAPAPKAAEPTKAPAAAAPAQPTPIPAQPTAAPAPTKAPEATKAPESTRVPAAAPIAPATQDSAAAGSAVAAIAGTPPGATPQSGLAAKTQPPAPTAVIGNAQAPATPALPAPQPSIAPPVAAPTRPAATATQPVPLEQRELELEWTPRMKLGNSEIIRLTLQPAEDGVKAVFEMQDSKLITREITIPRPEEYDIVGVASLDGVNYNIDPREQSAAIVPNMPMTWRWTVSPKSAGSHPLALNLFLRQVPRPGSGATPREYLLFSHGMRIDVSTVAGMSVPIAGAVGGAGTVLGGGLTVLALVRRFGGSKTRSNTPALRGAEVVAQNHNLVIEQRAGEQIPTADMDLMRALFQRYQRVVIEREFRSGYSGARTYLVLPVRPDGRNDAYTIAKIGHRADIEREHANYEQYVKDTLPPITARIQEAPTRLAGPAGSGPVGNSPAGAAWQQAAMRYTFIGEPGHVPMSLRQALLTHADPALLQKLFDTFGPNWWMQRKPYTFRVAEEYDRMLPPQLVMEPISAMAEARAVREASGIVTAAVGDAVRMPGFAHIEPRSSGPGLSLASTPLPGNAALRVRWLGEAFEPGTLGRVVATREKLLRDTVAGFDLFGLPDPLPKLQRLLDETLKGTQSTIHGDMNLENALVGPGGFLWLIDFAHTRDGHTLYDFAHLEAEIIAQVIAPSTTAADFARALQHADGAGINPQHAALLKHLHDIAGKCLLNPSQPREYNIALTLACLGALKFANLKPHSKHLLYLAAAFHAQGL